VHQIPSNLAFLNAKRCSIGRASEGQKRESSVLVFLILDTVEAPE
jgi:hypothetical protein